jgi:hypothetical protein
MQRHEADRRVRESSVGNGDFLHLRILMAITTASVGVSAQTWQQFLLALDGDFHGATGSAAQPSRLGEVLVDLVCQLAREVIAAF